MAESMLLKGIPFDFVSFTMFTIDCLLLSYYLFLSVQAYHDFPADFVVLLHLLSPRRQI